jgi:FKBP-type peptidyl-prolyl cis-trans isomerase 2
MMGKPSSPSGTPNLLGEGNRPHSRFVTLNQFISIDSRRRLGMKRHDLTKASLIISLACIAPIPIEEYGVGAEPLQASSSLSQEAESPRIVEGSKVTLQYVATVPGSTGVDYGNVSEYIQGQHQIFPALEQEVVGMKPGEEKKIELSPEEGFGPHDDRKKMNIPKTLLPFGAKEGDVVKNDVGELATVAELSDTSAVLDYNHPLAGKPLIVQLKILKVENP